MLWQLRIGNGLDGRIRREKLNNLARVADMLFHTQRQRFDALQNLKRRHRRHTGAEVANAFAPCAQKERQCRRFLGERHAVKARVFFAQRRKFARRQPIEFAAVDQHAANHRAVTAKKLRRRMKNQIGAEIEWPHQIRRGECGVHQQRHVRFVSDVGNLRNVQHVQAGITQSFAEQQPRVRANRRAPGVEIARIDERRFDAEAR